MKRTVVVLAAILALAGCGSAASHTSSKPKTSATNSPLAQKFIKDGESAGHSAGLPGSTASQVQANCGVLRLEDMPVGDLAKDWMTGCMPTGLLAANSG